MSNGQLPRAELSEHNRRQQSYFEARVKPTMVPADTPYLRRHVAELLRFGEISRTQRILEIGCGMGRYTLLLADLGMRVEGLDLTPVLLQRLRESAGNRQIPLHCADVLEAPAELSGVFDAVLGFFMLHHVHDLTLVFRGVSKLLRPGGRAVFLEPNAFNPLFYLQVALTPGMTWEGDKGIVRMRESVLFPALRDAGFRNAAIERFGFFPPSLANRPLGARMERWLESFPPWRGLLPFQLIRAESE